jgi:hypothetical protein
LNGYQQLQASAWQPLVFAFTEANRGRTGVAEFHQAIMQMEFHVLILTGVLPNESELHPTNVRHRSKAQKPRSCSGQHQPRPISQTLGSTHDRNSKTDQTLP